METVNFGKAAYIRLTNKEVPPDSNWVRAFVETGGKSPLILATLAEVTGTPQAPRSLFCGPRNVGGNDGILITIFFDSPPGANLSINVTVAQADAKRYQTPEVYIGT